MTLVPQITLRKWFLFGGLALVFGLAWWGYNVIEGKELRQMEVKIALLFTQFKSYSSPRSMVPVRFVGPTGNEMSLKDLRGGYVVMNLWATWCRPCIEELPALQRLQSVMRPRGVEVIGVSVDLRQDLEKIEGFLQQHGIGDVARYHDIFGEVQGALGIKALPMTYILDKRGRILYEIGGKADWTDPRIIAFLEKVAR
jgi:thiol-disulfide isomerase/thioredoxin